MSAPDVFHALAGRFGLPPRALYALITGIVAAGLLLSLCGFGAVLAYQRQQARAVLTVSPAVSAVAGAEDPFVCPQPVLNAVASVFATPGVPEGALGPALTATAQGTPVSLVVLPTAPPGRPIQSLAFLELPFPYDGGNENFGGTAHQFRQASQRTGQGGRINSFFDHFYPLYPAPDDPTIKFGREPRELPVARHILMFDGSLTEFDNYSGHPAYDYAPYVRRTPTTPLFAAADGLIMAVGEHSSGALFVKLKHTVPGVGDFQTIYWHLHPDEFFTAMLGREGQAITAGTRLGTMGNTGWSTGHHLHFEVRFDRNADGGFSADEAVDPYGFIPGAAYPVDPWAQPASFIDGQGEPYNHYPSYSDYLWIHPLGVSVEVPPEGGGQVAPAEGTGGEGGGSTLCAPPDSLPPGGTVTWSWVPDPRPFGGYGGVGQSCVIAAFDAQGQAVTTFDPPLAVTLSYATADLAGVDPQTMVMLWRPHGAADWTPLRTQIDTGRQLALAYVSAPGHCALMVPTSADLTAPSTTISLSGAAAQDGSLFDTVTITLASDDPSGVTLIEYSLDAGDTWLPYAGPITVDPNGLPGQVDNHDHTGEGVGGGPGRFLVLASAVDGAGNVEDPPAALRFGIDPSKGPTPTATATPPPTPTETPTPTQTPTPTRTLAPLFTATPSATPTPHPILFAADRSTVPVGYCMRLYWETENVSAVHLYGVEYGPAPGIGVGGVDSRLACPPSATIGPPITEFTYTLRVTLLDGTVVERTVTLRRPSALGPT